MVMRKVLLLCLALAACKESDAADFSAIKQTRDVHAWKQSVASEATPPGDVLGAIASAKGDGSNGMIKAEMDDGSMWAATDSDHPIRGATARELAAKFPLPSPADIGITSLIHSGKDGTWMLAYDTSLSLAAVAEHYKTVYAARGLEITHRLSVEESTEQWIQLGADSDKFHALATIKRAGTKTTVIAQWDVKSER